MQQAPGDDAVAEDLTRAVHVVEEGLQRADPPADAAGDEVPFGGVDDPGDQVEREGPLDPRVVEGDAAVGEHPGELGGPGAQLQRAERLEGGWRAANNAWYGGRGTPGRSNISSQASAMTYLSSMSAMSGDQEGFVSPDGFACYEALSDRSRESVSHSWVAPSVTRSPLTSPTSRQ